jgi:hypothetical protein
MHHESEVRRRLVLRPAGRHATCMQQQQQGYVLSVCPIESETVQGLLLGPAVRHAACMQQRQQQQQAMVWVGLPGSCSSPRACLGA